MSVSEYKASFLLKGVSLFTYWFAHPHRPTRDIDLLGFGDAVTPKPETINFPTVLDFPAPELKAYPKETVVAEKFAILVKLGMLNSRMKDFWDLSVLVNRFEFDGALLQKAIRATFERRQTAFSEKIPTALTAEFAEDAGKQVQRNAFL